MAYIHKNYNKNISLTEVSQVINVSPQYLSKLFKDECGQGFVHYLNSIRVEQAKNWIREGVPLKSLALKAGFNNYTYFFKVFKEVTGMTPQEWCQRDL